MVEEKVFNYSKILRRRGQLLGFWPKKSPRPRPEGSQAKVFVTAGKFSAGLRPEKERVFSGPSWPFGPRILGKGEAGSLFIR
jgi:hypothetical protein